MWHGTGFKCEKLETRVGGSKMGLTELGTPAYLWGMDGGLFVKRTQKTKIGWHHTI